MTDKEQFAADWQRVNVKDPNLFSVAAKRYVNHLIANSWVPNELKVSPLEIEILQFLSNNPEKSYLARDILREVQAASNRNTGNKIGSIVGPINMLVAFGYVDRNELKPYNYKISVKGLKLLNKIIGDYD